MSARQMSCMNTGTGTTQIHVSAFVAPNWKNQPRTSHTCKDTHGHNTLLIGQTMEMKVYKKECK